MEIYHGIGGKIWDAREEFLEEMTFKYKPGGGSSFFKC